VLTHNISTMNLYLSSEEYLDFKEVRKILDLRKIEIEERHLILVRISPPLIGQKYSRRGDNIETVYLTNKFIEDIESIKKLNKFPLNVLVLMPKSLEIIPSSLREFDNIAWACLYNNEKDARDYKII
jgi:hypothetical protein